MQVHNVGDTLKHMRELGYKVRVEHHRWAHLPRTLDGGYLAVPSLIRARDARETRALIDPRGGKVIVQVESPRAEYRGVADCSYQDNFNKKVGTTIALGRVLKTLEEAGEWM